MPRANPGEVWIVDLGLAAKAGQSFRDAFIAGYFDTIDEMHAVYGQYMGHTALSVDASEWRLAK